MNDNDVAFGFLCGTILGILIGVAAMAFIQVDLKMEAVKAGKAEYYLDENNNKQWRWK